MAAYRIRLDPEERETQALAALAGNLSRANVLEIGCGDGRLTWRYADTAKAVLAIDRDPVAIAAARAAMPDRLRQRVEFRCAGIEDVGLPPAGFDAAVLAWSL